METSLLPISVKCLAKRLLLVFCVCVCVCVCVVILSGVFLFSGCCVGWLIFSGISSVCVTDGCRVSSVTPATRSALLLCL